ncbi:hypothetical protein [Kosakonia oryzae]|uniref:Uncharacterized protein n=1 Tax=Kosakonia oryzae TaxID=497725 RepID=A0AA94H1L3_9ENTR|nr:hypothetical protein [Kosakonia oryzae]ANI83332.1 hypothetical protein AWR26_14640 [Kosakonia oryzae]UDJ80454.1 hypothetical protein I5186_14645 [Kosakonia oryzae]SFC02123.1 hypothetical protein SAMN05216286_1324 [Kosakonia oryzae]
MINKRKITDAVINFIDSWNKEFHESFEEKISRGYLDAFPQHNHSIEEVDKTKKEMREFYHSRMVATASILITIASFAVSIVALIVAVIALFVGGK